MEYLNWIAEHWLLTIVLVWLVTGGTATFMRALASAIVAARKGS
jgi:hypothetical protein